MPHGVAPGAVRKAPGHEEGGEAEAAGGGGALADESCPNLMRAAMGESGELSQKLGVDLRDLDQGAPTRSTAETA